MNEPDSLRSPFYFLLLSSLAGFPARRISHIGRFRQQMTYKLASVQLSEALNNGPCIRPTDTASDMRAAAVHRGRKMVIRSGMASYSIAQGILAIRQKQKVGLEARPALGWA